MERTTALWAVKGHFYHILDTVLKLKKMRLSHMMKPCFVFSLLPELFFLLHKKVKELEQRRSSHLIPCPCFHWFMQCWFPPQLFGSPECQNVNSKGLPSVHFQAPSSSMSFPPIHVLLKPLLFIPSTTYWLIASEVIKAKLPFSCWQKASASFHVLVLVLQ